MLFSNPTPSSPFMLDFISAASRSMVVDHAINLYPQSVLLLSLLIILIGATIPTPPDHSSDDITPGEVLIPVSILYALVKVSYLGYTGLAWRLWFFRFVIGHVALQWEELHRVAGQETEARLWREAQ
jgi:hypothetical protein